MNVAAASFTVEFLTTGTFNTALFNAVELTDLAEPFTSAVLGSSTLDGMSQSEAFLSNGSIYLSLQGLHFRSGDQVTVDFNLSSATVTPEPSSILLLGTGLLGVACALKRRLP